MQPTTIAKSKGFTLVELLIVVIILAVLAAIVVPQFSANTDDAKLASSKSNLSAVRSAIDFYYQQHGHYPGGVATGNGPTCNGVGGSAALNTEAAMLDHLTRYSNSDGATCSRADAGYDYGPYLKTGIPTEAVSNDGAVEIDASGDLAMEAAATAAGGWKYDPQSGKFIINHPDRDEF